MTQEIVYIEDATQTGLMQNREHNAKQPVSF